MQALTSKLIKGVAVTALTLFGSLATANPHNMEHRLEKMSEHLGLSKDQQTAIASIMEANKPQAKATHKEIKALKEQLHEQMKSDELNEGKIKSLHQAIAEKKAEMMILHAKSMRLMKEQLTEEQVAKFEEMKEKHGRRGERKHQRHFDDDDQE